jgi:hypothetical protein
MSRSDRLGFHASYIPITFHVEHYPDIKPIDSRVYEVTAWSPDLFRPAAGGLLGFVLETIEYLRLIPRVFCQRTKRRMPRKSQEPRKTAGVGQAPSGATSDTISLDEEKVRTSFARSCFDVLTPKLISLVFSPKQQGAQY